MHGCIVCLDTIDARTRTFVRIMHVHAVVLAVAVVVLAIPAVGCELVWTVEIVDPREAAADR